MDQSENANTTQDMPTTRSLTMLNISGDTTIEWEPDADDIMLAFIEKKMAAGVTFYMISKRTSGQNGRVAKQKKLTNPSLAMKSRTLSVGDADLAKLILDGVGRVTPSPSTPAHAPIQTVGRAKTPREVSSGHSVGVQPRRGG